MTDFELPQSWRLALEIIQYGFPDAVIAGGALRDLILGREPKDIDVFAEHPSTGFSTGSLVGANTAEIKEWAERYLGPARCVINSAWANYNEGMDGVVCAVEIDTALTRPLPIQLIMMNRPMTLQSAVERIDFGLCRVSHDGARLYRHPDFDHDVTNQCFTLRRSNSLDQYDRSRARHRRLEQKYLGWPFICDYKEMFTADFLAPFRCRAGANKLGFKSCPFCKASPDVFPFKDRLSAMEYQISGLCQSCQDGFFTP